MSQFSLSPSADTERSDVGRSHWLRRNTLELVACAVIALGILMLLQPFALVLYTWSFATMLAGTVMFMVVSKFPQ
jgi:hypothetical protein